MNVKSDSLFPCAGDVSSLGQNTVPQGTTKRAWPCRHGKK